MRLYCGSSSRLFFFLANIALMIGTLSLSSSDAMAQPAVVFKAGLMNSCAYFSPSMSIVTSSVSTNNNWNDGAGHHYIEISDASASGNSITLSNTLSVQNSGTSNGSICTGWKVEAYSSHPSDAVLSASGSASGAFNNATYGNESFPYLLTGMGYNRTESSSGGPGSGSAYLAANRICSSSASFSYLGTTYYLVGSAYTAYAFVDVTGSSAYGEMQYFFV